MSLSLDQMKAVVKRFVVEPWQNGDLSVLDEVCAPNYTLEGVNNLEALKRGVEDFRRQVRDLSVTIGTMIAEGDSVAYPWTMIGSHATTHKPIKVTGITIVKFADGKIVRDQFQSSSPSIEDQVK